MREITPFESRMEAAAKTFSFEREGAQTNYLCSKFPDQNRKYLSSNLFFFSNFTKTESQPEISHFFSPILTEIYLEILLLAQLVL